MHKKSISIITFMFCFTTVSMAYAADSQGLLPLPDLPNLPVASSPATQATMPSSGVPSSVSSAHAAPSNTFPELQLPSLPAAPTSSKTAAAPTTNTGMPPLPLEPFPAPTSSAIVPPKTENTAVLDTSASTPTPASNPTPVAKEEVTASTKTPAKSKKKHFAKNHTTVHYINAGIRPNYYISEPLPQAIFRKSYDYNNRHLPVAMYEGDYNRLVFVSAANDDVSGLRSLLDNSSRNVELMDEAGDTPLLVAVKHQAINTARLLLARHANPQVIDRLGRTPWQIAIATHNYPMQRALEEMGGSTAQQVSSN